jgi:hypothetical protein
MSTVLVGTLGRWTDVPYRDPPQTSIERKPWFIESIFGLTEFKWYRKKMGGLWSQVGYYHVLKFEKSWERGRPDLPHFEYVSDINWPFGGPYIFQSEDWT